MFCFVLFCFVVFLCVFLLGFFFFGGGGEVGVGGVGICFIVVNVFVVLSRYFFLGRNKNCIVTSVIGRTLP